MYLNVLTQKQKELFLEISLHVAHADNDYCEAEQKVINQLCSEMGIPAKKEATLSFGSAINDLAKICGETEKRIVVLELAGVVMANDEYAEEEKDIMKKVSDTFNIDYSEIEDIVSVINDLFKTYKKLSDFVNKKQ